MAFLDFLATALLIAGGAFLPVWLGFLVLDDPRLGVPLGVCILLAAALWLAARVGGVVG